MCSATFFFERARSASPQLKPPQHSVFRTPKHTQKRSPLKAYHHSQISQAYLLSPHPQGRISFSHPSQRVCSTHSHD
nr:hypothetical protein [uncultured bacterium]